MQPTTPAEQPAKKLLAPLPVVAAAVSLLKLALVGIRLHTIVQVLQLLLSALLAAAVGWCCVYVFPQKGAVPCERKEGVG